MTPSPRSANSRSSQKLQRWIDLLAALLSHHYGVTYERLRELVPAYAAGAEPATVARMFERDKDELRALGIPIDTIDHDEEPPRYKVDAREMYLPYLLVASGKGPRQGGNRLRSGYRAIPSLTFEPSELRALVQACRQVAAIDDPAVANDAASALRKLAYDLDVPVGSALGEAEDVIVAPREPATAGRLRVLGEALLRLKRVSFNYRSMSSDVTTRRTVEPYGVFFLSGHWYLAGRDVDKGALRNFRVSRMDDLQLNSKRAQSTDYQVPSDFRLSDHAKARGAWEIGEGDAEEMVVEFVGTSGVTMSALQLGSGSPLGERYRTFGVRRVDTFARWLLSFAGEARPVSPPRLLEEYRAVAAATLAVYGDAS